MHVKRSRLERFADIIVFKGLMKYSYNVVYRYILTIKIVTDTVTTILSK